LDSIMLCEFDILFVLIDLLRDFIQLRRSLIQTTTFGRTSDGLNEGQFQDKKKTKCNRKQKEILKSRSLQTKGIVQLYVMSRVQ
jgi:hypothetical protein